MLKSLKIKSDSNPGVFFQVDGIIAEDGSITAKNTVKDFSFVIPKPLTMDELEAMVVKYGMVD